MAASSVVSSSDHDAAIRAAAESRQALEVIAPPDAPLAGFSGTRRVPPPFNNKAALQMVGMHLSTATLTDVGTKLADSID